jgi:Tfp pilus assembly protein FimT
MKIRKYKAFSALELLTIIAMITILTAISLSSMSRIRPDAKLKAAQRELAATIKQAQSYALEGKNIPGTSSISSFGICFDDSKTYKLIYNDDCSKVVESASLGVVTMLYSSGWADGYKVNFNVPDGLPSPSGAGASLPLTITLTDGTTSKTVKIDIGGAVTEAD